MALAISSWWIVGWVAGGVVVAVAASLLITVIALGRRVVRQAADITAALDGTRENTLALYDVTRTNLAIDQITRGLERARMGGP